MVNGTIDIAAGSFPSNPTIRVDINDFDNMPEYISLDRVGSEPDSQNTMFHMSDNLAFSPYERMEQDDFDASGAFTGPTFNYNYAIIDSNLVWTNGSDITITIDKLDSPSGSVTYSVGPDGS